MTVQDNLKESGEYAGVTAEVVDRLRQDYLDELAEKLDQLENDLDQVHAGNVPLSGVTDNLRMFAFEAKGQSNAFGLTLLNVVTQRLQDYIGNIDALTPEMLDDMRTFLEKIGSIVHGKIASGTTPADVVRDLPAKPGFEASSVEVRNLEIMLVMQHGAASRHFQRELQECGYRVNIVTSEFEALPLIVRTQPDMVIVSAVLTELSGVGFVSAIKAMTETRNVSVALITSFERDHPDLEHLPESVPIIRKGEMMGDDLTAALQQQFLI